MRMILNYIEIPFTTEWVEYPDIEPTLKKMSIEPQPAGPAYTLPAIKDGDICIMDRLAIFDHLKNHYSSPLFDPKDDKYFKALSEYTTDVLKKKMRLVMAFVADFMTPAGRDFFIEGKKKWAKLDCLEFQMQDEVVVEAKENFTDEFKNLKGIDPYLAKHGIPRSELKAGKFLFTENEPTMADFCLAGLVFWLEAAIENSTLHRFPYMDEWSMKWWDEMSQYTV